MAIDTLNRLILDVPDFPKPGIVFKDICPVLEDPEGMRTVVDALAASWSGTGLTRIVGIESRGFIFGAAVAYAMGLGLALVRKPGKLPRETFDMSYELEYGTDRVEMHTDAVGPADRVLVLDDVLATGGTAEAVGRLCAKAGAQVVGYGFVLELAALGGRGRLSDALVQSLLIV